MRVFGTGGAGHSGSHIIPELDSTWLTSLFRSGPVQVDPDADPVRAH